MIKILGNVALLVTMSALAAAQTNVAITVDAARTYQTIEGFGTCLISWDPTMTAWYQRPESARMFAEELGLNILRCNLWGDGTIGEMPAAQISHLDPNFARNDTRTPIFLDFAKAVRRLNPDLKVIGTVWSPPAWMKFNNSITDTGGGYIDGNTYQQEVNGVRIDCRNRVRGDRYPHFAKWLTEMVRYYERNGVPVHAVSAANEPQFTQGFESCVWTATDLSTITGLTGDALAAANLGRVKLFGPETMTGFNWEGGPNRTYTAALKSNPAAWSRMGFYATHGYADGVSGDTSSNSSAQLWDIIKNDGKALWMTEGSTGLHNWPAPVRAGGVALAVHNSLVAGNSSAFVPWQFAEGGDSEHALTRMKGLDKKGFAMRQFSRFIPAGSVRIDATPGFGDVAASAYKKGTATTIVLVNPGTTARRVTLTLRGLTGLRSLNVVRTTALENGAVLRAQPVLAGTVRVTLPADSIVTLTTQNPPRTRL